MYVSFVNHPSNSRSLSPCTALCTAREVKWVNENGVRARRKLKNYHGVVCAGVLSWEREGLERSRLLRYRLSGRGPEARASVKTSFYEKKEGRETWAGRGERTVLVEWRDPLEEREERVSCSLPTALFSLFFKRRGIPTALFPLPPGPGIGSFGGSLVFGHRVLSFFGGKEVREGPKGEGAF